MLYQVTTQRYCAGFETNEQGKIVRAAPILARKLLGRHVSQVQAILHRVNLTKVAASAFTPGTPGSTGVR
jgi:hypothetical protein